MKKNTREEFLLKQAVAAYVEEEMTRLPSDEEIGVHQFSPEFERKMEKLLRHEHRPHRILLHSTGKRVAVLAAVIALLAASMLSVGAVRESIVSFFTEVYEEFTAIIFDQPEEMGRTYEADSIDAIEVTYIPEGFELISESKNDVESRMEYVDDCGNRIIIRQTLNRNTQKTIDTEDVESEEVVVKKYRGIYFENKGFGTLIWDDSKQSFEIAGNVERDEIFKVAESIQITTE